MTVPLKTGIKLIYRKSYILKLPKSGSFFTPKIPHTGANLYMNQN